jgi:hypothetical protein
MGFFDFLFVTKRETEEPGDLMSFCWSQNEKPRNLYLAACSMSNLMMALQFKIEKPPIQSKPDSIRVQILRHHDVNNLDVQWRAPGDI